MPPRDPSGTDGRVAHRDPRTTAPPLSGPAWFAARLLSNQEFKVEGLLSGAAIEAFLPTFVEETRWTDRSKVITRPLFSGYIFLRIDPAELDRARRIAGVVHILGTDRPEAIPDVEIENVRRALASQGTVEPCPYVAGEAVRIERGPLAGVSGIVKRTAGATRVIVAIEILKRAVSVEIDAADLA
jgi:transcription antitermination factor NusG